MSNVSFDYTHTFNKNLDTCILNLKALNTSLVGDMLRRNSKQ